MRPKSNDHLGREGYHTGIRGLRLFCVSLAIHLFLHSFAPSLLAQKWNPDNTTTRVRSTDKGTSTQTHSNAPAAVSAPAPPRSKSNRFLIAFDTSAPMKSQMASITEAIDQILLSRASGQLYRGDTLGIWTFDTELYTGNFPLQVWTPEDEKDVVARVNDFVKKQRFAKQSRFDALLPAVHELMKQSDIITIIIISDGQNQMQGTPFDREINKSYQQNLRDMGNDPMPIVTVLQAKGGKYIKHNVTALPWPVIIPELPIPLKDEEIAASSTHSTPNARTNVAKTKSVAEPLIISGPKPAQPAPTTAPLPQPEVKSEAQVTAQPPSAAPVTPAPARVTPTPAPIAKGETPPAVQQPATPPPTPSTPVPTPTVSPRAEVPPQPKTPVVIPKPSTPEVASAPESKPEPTPADESTTLKQSSQKTESPAVQPESAGAPAKPVTIATASPAQSRPKALLIAAISLVAIALGLIVLMFRRAHTTSGPSLITRSMTNRRK